MQRKCLLGLLPNPQSVLLPQIGQGRLKQTKKKIGTPDLPVMNSPASEKLDRYFRMDTYYCIQDNLMRRFTLKRSEHDAADGSLA